jgi:uncharacterized protein YegL
MANDKITPFNSQNGKPTFGGLKKVPGPGNPSRLTGLQARLAAAKKASSVEDACGIGPETRTNRIALMLDCSGSMQGERIKSLKEATEGFLQSLSLGPQGDTSVSCTTFPLIGAACYPLVIDYGRSVIACWQLDTLGCTPMHDTLASVIENQSITRGILMSDGRPDSPDAAFQEAQKFQDAEIPIDCVHISESVSGEEFLKQVAELTGGLFIKFTDINSFAKNFKYLSPALRPLMLSGAVGAQELGASEVKR